MVLFLMCGLWVNTEELLKRILTFPVPVKISNAGKRSPDGKFLEAIYNREIARRVVADLRDRGYDAALLVPEEEDIPLKERVRRVNAACSAPNG